MLMIALALVSVAGYSQDVLGKWYTEAGDAQVEIYQAGESIWIVGEEADLAMLKMGILSIISECRYGTVWQSFLLHA